MIPVILIVMLLQINVSTAAAELISEPDIPARYASWDIAYEVNADGSYVEAQKRSVVILKENALENFKTASVTFSTSVAKGEILEAYTMKRSGRRIDVPSGSYQVSINNGYKNASPLYSDETTITVIFPDLAVGDSTVISYRITNEEGMFPGHFSIAHVFPRFWAYDDIIIRITAPGTMPLRHESYFLSAQEPVEKDGRKTFEWTYQNKRPQKWTPAERGISAAGDEPSVYVSTFGSYRQIAEAYGNRAVPKAAVTERVKALASQIVADRSAPESQTRALYDWVARNISYGGNCIGIGAVVPRDLDVVLDNRMGDCKDHATLLQALLAARNIESEQALVNAGGRYDLPPVPVVSAVNHVINYIPSMKLFVDSTASSIPFGMLPPTLGEKPVLLVSNYREGMRIPSTAQYGHEQIMRTNVRVNSDGTATGTVRISLRGDPAVTARATMRNVTGDQEEYVVRKILEAQGLHGTGKLQKDDPTELLDVFNLSVSFQLEDLLVVASTIGMPIKPVVYSFLPIESFVRDAYEPLPNKSEKCSGGRSVEEYIYELPASLNIVGFPKDYSFSSATVDYNATYRKSDTSIQVTRELRDKTSSNICSVGFTEEYRKSARTIMRDIRSQVLITQ